MTLKTTKKLRALTAAALSAAMLVSFAACGTSDATDKDSGTSKTTTTGYDVSSVKKDSELATLVEGNTVKDGELSVGMELSYAPAEFPPRTVRPRPATMSTSPRPSVTCWG